ncbi:hypothetical protein J7K19_10120 [bacterium]|nr:hypothetical protein [bacterium]
MGCYKWHDTAVAIRDALTKADAELVYFDCVLNEVISVLTRRFMAKWWAWCVVQEGNLTSTISSELP